MNESAAVRKNLPAPPTTQQLKAAAADTERLLLEAKRMNATARAALRSHLESGDEDAIAECRREIQRSGAEATELTEYAEAQRDAVNVAERRERLAANALAARHLEQMISTAREDVEALADSIVSFANALKRSVTGLNSVDALMARSGMTLDPYVLRAKLVGTVEMALHLETDGIIGRPRTLDNAHQLRESGRADLKRAALEYQTLTLQRIRSALRIQE